MFIDIKDFPGFSVNITTATLTKLLNQY